MFSASLNKRFPSSWFYFRLEFFSSYFLFLFFTADFGDKLSQILSNQKLTVAKERQPTKEEIARKEAILAQYNQMSDEEYP